MSLTENELQQRLNHALAWSREAADLILGHYQSQGLSVDRKSDESPVTIADRDAEALLRKRVGETYPQDGFLGEEHGEVESQNGLRWIVDPIDGTKAFVAGVPMFGTLIGLETGVGSSDASDVVLGICRFPALDEVIYAASGLGAHWKRGNDTPGPARVSTVSKLAEALFCYTEYDLFQRVDRVDVYDKCLSQCRAVRGWGDCYGHMLVATGRAEFIADPLMNAWDAAALLPILREAGGSYTSWRGESTIHDGTGVSVNAALKDDVLALLSGE